MSLLEERYVANTAPNHTKSHVYQSSDLRIARFGSPHFIEVSCDKR